MNKINCPVENCNGFETTSGHPSPANHIKNLAKGELLRNFISGNKNKPHADWLKANAVLQTKTIFRIGDNTFSFKEEL